MKKTHASFIILLMIFIYIAMSSVTSAKDLLPIERTPSLAEQSEEVFFRKHVDSISWIYERQGKPSEMIASPSPLISYRVEVMGNADYRIIMHLNGQEVAAHYDRSTGRVTYQTQNLTGQHHVSIALEVYNQTYDLASWHFTVDPFPVNPFKNQRQSLLATIQEESIIQMNQYRAALSLPYFIASDSLQKAAQAHSNYLSENNVTGHTESPGGIGYVGSTPTARGDYFGYLGSVGEGITYEKKTGALGIDELMDAPYHRLSIIDPKSTFAGIGYNNRGDIVVNYGAMPGTEQATDVVLYPYNNQTDAKVSWFVAENPNPLRFWGLNRIHVGYPISYAYFPKQHGDQLIVTNLSLKDSQNDEVPFYDVTPNRETHGNHHVFLIPKSPLTPGETYIVSVQAYARDQAGQSRDISRDWSFQTAEDIDVQDIYFTKSNTTNFLHVSYNSGEDPNSVIQMERNGTVYIERKNNLQWTRNQVVAGDYTITIESPLFNTTKEVPITVEENTQPRFDKDGDWHVSFHQETPMPPAPTLDLIAIEPITNLSKEVMGKATPGVIIVMTANGNILDTTVVSQDGTFQFPLPEPITGTELQFYAKDQNGDKGIIISVDVMDVIGLSGYDNWEPQPKPVPKTKEWTIRFSKEVDPATVNAMNFHVQYNQQKVQDIEIVLNADKKSVTVKAPEKGYDEEKTYFLYIENHVQSTDGKSLSKPIKLQFSIHDSDDSISS